MAHGLCTQRHLLASGRPIGWRSFALKRTSTSTRNKEMARAHKHALIPITMLHL